LKLDFDAVSWPRGLEAFPFAGVGTPDPDLSPGQLAKIAIRLMPFWISSS